MLSWLFRNRIFLFLWATITGCLFALVWKQYEQTIHRTLTYYRITPSSFDYQWYYKLWLENEGLRSLPIVRANVSESSKSQVIEDKWLMEKVPVYCIILAKAAKHTKAVKNTWTRHCNRALFYGSFSDDTIPVNKIASKDGWSFLCQVLVNVWEGYRDDFKWVLISGDKTYAIIENLRYMIAGLDSNDPHYLGHAFRDYDGQYNVEDAGYALSRATLAAFYKQFPNVEACSRIKPWQGSDRTLGKFLEEIGIRPRDTRDIKERSRFLPFNIEKLLIPGAISVFSRYWRDSVFLSPEGASCCSDFVVTFSDIPPNKMYMMEYIIYHLKPMSSTWPPVDDVGPPTNSDLSTTAPVITGKPKAVGKALVSEITAKKKDKITDKENAKYKYVKTRDVPSLTKSTTTVAKASEPVVSRSRDVDNVKAGIKPQISNGHTNHDGFYDNGIDMNLYDDAFKDAEEDSILSGENVNRDAEIRPKKAISISAAAKEDVDNDPGILLNSIE